MAGTVLISGWSEAIETSCCCRKDFAGNVELRNGQLRALSELRPGEPMVLQVPWTDDALHLVETWMARQTGVYRPMTPEDVFDPDKPMPPLPRPGEAFQTHAGRFGGHRMYAHYLCSLAQPAPGFWQPYFHVPDTEFLYMNDDRPYTAPTLPAPVHVAIEAGDRQILTSRAVQFVAARHWDRLFPNVLPGTVLRSAEPGRLTGVRLPVVPWTRKYHTDDAFALTTLLFALHQVHYLYRLRFACVDDLLACVVQVPLRTDVHPIGLYYHGFIVQWRPVLTGISVARAYPYHEYEERDALKVIRDAVNHWTKGRFAAYSTLEGMITGIGLAYRPHDWIPSPLPRHDWMEMQGLALVNGCELWLRGPEVKLGAAVVEDEAAGVVRVSDLTGPRDTVLQAVLDHLVQTRDPTTVVTVRGTDETCHLLEKRGFVQHGSDFIASVHQLEHGSRSKRYMQEKRFIPRGQQWDLLEFSEQARCSDTDR
jgi:hypothetical protein